MDHKNFYENMEEAQFRLNNSVVLYDGEPVYIVGLENNKDGIIRVNMQSVPLDPRGERRESTRKMINSPKFNRFRPFSLGNMNYLYEGSIIPIRLERLPARTHTQGLTARSLQIEAIGPTLRNMGFRIDFNMAISNDGFSEMAKNIYPTVAEVLAENVDACAVHQDLTLSKSESNGMTYIYHKTAAVAIMSVKRDVFLFPKFGYLKEMLEATKLFSRVLKDTF